MADIDLPQRRILHDTGYLDASRTALENLAKAMERERAWAITADGRHVVLHAADVAREQREQKEAAEAAAEAERLAAPDPRETLRAALQLQREAENEVVRVTGQLERAKELVTSLEERVGDQQGRIAAGEAAAVAQLLTAFADGAGTSPEPALPPGDAYGRRRRPRINFSGTGMLLCRHGKRTEEHIEYLYRYRRCVRTRGIQGGRSPRIGSPCHAPRSEGNRAMKLLDAASMPVNSASRIGDPVPGRFAMDGGF